MKPGDSRLDPTDDGILCIDADDDAHLV